MAKLTLDDVANLSNENTAVATLAANNAATELALENTLSRDGTAPNQMGAALDMNSHRILNLPTPATQLEPLRLQDLTDFIGDGLTVSPLPTGGTTGDFLAKTGSTDYDVGWSTPVNYEEIVELESFGGGTDVADNRVAWTAALAYCLANGIRTIKLRAGSYNFTGKPDVITRGITVQGLSKSATNLVRNYTAGSATEGFIEFDGSSGEFSGGVRELQVLAATGTTTGVGIKLIGVTTTSRASFNSFYDMVVSGSGTGTWSYAIYADGVAITTAGSQGLRDLAFFEVYAFNATVATVYMKNCINVGWFGGGLFQGAGSVCKVVITGGTGGSTEESQYVQFQTNLVGTFETTYCSRVKFLGELDVYSRNSTADDVVIIGTLGGQSGTAATREMIIDSVTGIDSNAIITGRGGFYAPGATNVPPFKNQIGAFGGTTNGDGYLAANAYYDTAGTTWRTISTYGVGVVGYTIIQAGILGTAKVAGSTAATTAGASVTPTFVDIVKQGDTINVGNGTLAAPAVYFTDVNTGFYSPSAGNLVASLDGFAGATFSATQFIQARDGAAPNITAARMDAHGSGQDVGKFVFRGFDNTATPVSTIYAQLTGNCVSNVDTAEEGKFDLQVVTGGTLTTILSLVGASATSAKGLYSSHATSGLGYSTGAGGAVTQITSRTTGVTLNKVSGAITLFNAAPTVGTWVSCTVTNSAVAATDTVVVSVKSGTNTYICHVTAVAAGSFQISFTSIVGTTADSPVINFAVIKAVAA